MAWPAWCAGVPPELLRIENLRTVFRLSDGVVKAVDGVSLSVAEGEVLGLVGESGSGKSITCRSIMRLLPPAARIEGGAIYYRGENVLTWSERALTAWRGGDFSALLKVGANYQIYDPLSGVAQGSRVARTAFTNNLIPASRLSAISEVSAEFPCFPLERSNLLCRFSAAAGFGADAANVCTGFRERDCNRAAEAAARSSYECALSVEAEARDSRAHLPSSCAAIMNGPTPL